MKKKNRVSRKQTPTQAIPWHKEAIVYEVYPRSFKDSDGNGVGDLNGITEKLDYFNDGTENSLGVNTLWIPPIYPSPMADFGYDVSDYCNIDPLFGNLSDFEKLITEAHARNIKIILDFVPNHTSHEHAWFKESRASKNNPKREWYTWKDPKPDARLPARPPASSPAGEVGQAPDGRRPDGGQGSPPNNWLSVFGGSAWQYDEHTKQYYLHSFLKEQPDLNWYNAEVREALKNALRFWLNRGVDGIRADAIYWLAKDRQFRDDPPNPKHKEGKDEPYMALLHSRSKNQPELFGFLRELGGVLSEYPERFMITEAYPDQREDIEEYMKFYRHGDPSVMAPFNFEAIFLPWQAHAYRRFIDGFQAALGADHMPIYVLGNHDRPRAASRLGLKQARVAAMMLLSLPGMPFLYYGEELGMKDIAIPKKKIRDPWEKNIPGLGLGRDPERTPMQWNGETHAGFSSVEPWLPVAKNYREVNVEKQTRDPQSMLALYRKMIHWRKKSSALRHGTYESLDLGAHHQTVFAYWRRHKDEKVLVVLNFSDKKQNLSLRMKNATLICNTHLDKTPGSVLDLTRFSLRPHEGYLFTV